MKKVFNISLLAQFLPVMGLLVLSILIFLSFNANSSSLKIKEEVVPTKRPVNLLSLEESADTIFNLVQKVGAKPVTNIQKTKLKKK